MVEWINDEQRARWRPVAWATSRWAGAAPFTTATLVIVGVGLAGRSLGSGDPILIKAPS